MTQGRDIKSEGVSEAMVLKTTRLDEITKGVNVDREEFKVGGPSGKTMFTGQGGVEEPEKEVKR